MSNKLNFQKLRLKNKSLSKENNALKVQITNSINEIKKLKDEIKRLENQANSYLVNKVKGQAKIKELECKYKDVTLLKEHYLNVASKKATIRKVDKAIFFFVGSIFGLLFNLFLMAVIK